MIIYSNMHLEAGEEVRIKGDRHLLIANNTEISGKEFKNVHVFYNKLGRKSLVTINKLDKTKSNIPVELGLFFGENLEAVKGMRFLGSAMKNNRKYSVMVFSTGGIVKTPNRSWLFHSQLGWI